MFEIGDGDWLVVLGDEERGIALMKADRFLAVADAIKADIDRGQGTPK